MEFLFVIRNFRAKGKDHYRSGATSSRWRRRGAWAGLRCRIPPTAVSLMLMSMAELLTVELPHAANAAEAGCLSLERGAQEEEVAFSPPGRGDPGCMSTKLPLVQKTILGSGNLFSDLEFSDLDLGQMSAHEVKLKFGVGRDLPLGVHASVDGSVGRVLGDLTPVHDGQLRASLSRRLDGYWDTGFESRLVSLGTLGLTQISETTTQLFLRARYNLFGNHGVEQHLEFKLSADTADSTAQSPQHHARADLRYEYRRDANVLSIRLSATDTAQSPAPCGAISVTPSLRLDLRATRKF